MRLNNQKTVNFIRLIYSISFILIFIGVFLILVPIETFTKFFPAHYYVLAGTIMIVALLYLGHQHVEFDSDGEALNIKTDEVFLSKYLGGMKKSAEFPKHKLVSFKVSKGLFKKTLHLIITSKRTDSGKTKLSFNITYVSKNSRSDIKRSLRKVIETNKRERKIEAAAKQNERTNT